MSMVWRTSTRSTGSTRFRLEWKPIVHGNFPARALRHVLEWSALHRQELLDNWELARHGKPLNRITPSE